MILQFYIVEVKGEGEGCPTKGMGREVSTELVSHRCEVDLGN